MIWTIAKRELITRGRSRGFQIVSFIMFVAVLVVALLLSVLGGDDEARDVVIGVEGDGAQYSDILAVGDEDLAPEITVTTDGITDVEEGIIDVLFDGETLTWEESPDRQLDTYIRGAVQQVAIGSRIDDLGVGQEAIAALFEPVDLEEVRLDGGEGESGVRLAAAAAAAFANFILIQVWGAFLMMGVTEEKSSKVVEVLLAHVRPATLLSGKVLGLGILALGQMLILVTGIVLGLLLVQDVEVPAGVWGTVPLLLVTFLLGFGFYATAFAAVGSMVSRQEDAQTAQLPVVMPLMLGYFIASFSVGEPNNPVVLVASFIPFTSPVILPFRTAVTDVPIWQIGLSLAILAGSIVIMLKLAGRIYRYSLLRSGTRVSMAEAWRNRNQETLV